MINVILERKVTNAANRKDDAWIRRETVLAAVPGVTHKVALDFGAPVEVEEVIFVPGDHRVTVRLKPDHSSFKANKPAGFFAEKLMSYLNTGWEIR